MYARGMTVREIQGHLRAVYAVDVAPDLISKVTSAVMEEVRGWQTRPLAPVYPVMLFDALRIKIRDEGMAKNKAVYVALGINVEGIKKLLGLWVEQTEGAKFWMRVMTELKNRGGRHPDRGGGWPQEPPRGSGPDLHRAHGAALPEIRALEGTCGHQTALPGDP